MHVDLDDAIKIYAKACISWYGERAQKVVLKHAQELHKRGDFEGSKVWQRLATEVASANAETLQSRRFI
jgi:hypothetical protein